MIETFLKLVNDKKIFEHEMHSIPYDLDSLESIIAKDCKDYVFVNKQYNDNFEALYALILKTVTYKSTFTQEQIRELCFDIFSLLFDYKILISGHDFQARYKNPTHMSNKLSSFWYQRARQSMVVPVEFCGDFPSDHPASLRYDFRFNDEYVYLQNHLNFYVTGNQRIASTVTRFFDISFKKVDNIYTYTINADRGQGRNPDTNKVKEIYHTKSFVNFDEFKTDLTRNFSKCLYVHYYKQKCEEYIGYSLEFEDFVLADFKSLFEMVEY